MVKDTQGLLPLTPQKQKRILLLAASDGASFFADKAATGDEFARMLIEEGFTVVREYEVKEEGNEIDAVVFLLQKSPGFMQNSMSLSLVGKQPFRGESPIDAFCGLEWAKL